MSLVCSNTLRRRLYRFEQDAAYLDLGEDYDRKTFVNRVIQNLSKMPMSQIRQLHSAMGVVGSVKSKHQGAKSMASHYIKHGLPDNWRDALGSD